MSVADLAVDVEHPSARISGVLAVMAGLIAVVSVAFSMVLALGLAVLGLVALATGVFVIQSRTGVGIGAGMLFLAVLLGGIAGNPAVMVLSGTLGAIVALDLGQNAVSVGRQLSADAYTRRGESVHAAASVVVGVLVATLGYGVYFASPEGQPASALVLLLLAGVLLIWSIRT